MLEYFLIIITLFGAGLHLYISTKFQDKKSLTLSPDDHLHLEGFALNVFAKADKQDRAGRADMYASL